MGSNFDERDPDLDNEADLVEVDYTSIIHETDAAYLFAFDDDEVWLPKSQIKVDSDAKTITLPEWMAIEKELV